MLTLGASTVGANLTEVKYGKPAKVLGTLSLVNMSVHLSNASADVIRRFSFRAWYVRQAVRQAKTLEALRNVIHAGLREIRCLLRFGYDCGLPQRNDLVPIGFTSRVSDRAKNNATPRDVLMREARAVVHFLEKVESWLFEEELEPPIFAVGGLV
ncbi:hypothetical protein [Cerasicoccus arenae]|uniref:Uncharacterized protein n=1 Tax=Cerasicoccus arenae TaxID=424488 RepID=A0A8J3DJW7_9BACT|nr:hypothetical protein [Cerasicoccus arenae]MBK1858206.1 hypothetical protein [Cerasicoccus arenae]GHC01903.1 hypothetical protein GCM10007047_17940 [Cerasicoccus arenae]